MMIYASEPLFVSMSGFKVIDVIIRVIEQGGCNGDLML